MHSDGVVGIFRTAHRSGTIAALSTFAGSPPEVLANEPGPRWFQLYATDRDMASDLMARARQAGFEALVVTLDSATGGKRERDAGSSAAATSKLTFRSAALLAPQLAIRPRWMLKMLNTALATFRHATLPAQETSPFGPPRSPGGSRDPFAPPRVSPFTWDDLRWIREQWSGPLLLKSIVSAEDARRSIDVGADAIIVSNHGGRQLEGAPATMRVLPGIVDAVGSDVEVLVDSGIRRGADVVKALALGARAVLIGRPYCFGFAAAGEAGVHRVIEILRADMVRTMALMGCASVHDLDCEWIQPA